MNAPVHKFLPTVASDETPSIGLASLRDYVPDCSVIFVSGALMVAGTSSAEPQRLWEAPYYRSPEATGSGPDTTQAAPPLTEGQATPIPTSTASAIAELRRLSGLTWQQLSDLFGVSPRSMHFWASGNALSAGNERRLLSVLAIVRAAACGDVRTTRAALQQTHDGVTPLGLLTQGRDDEARLMLGRGPGRSRPVLRDLDSAARVARRPLAPEERVEAKHDRVHQEIGRARAARTVRNKRRGKG